MAFLPTHSAPTECLTGSIFSSSNQQHVFLLAKPANGSNISNSLLTRLTKGSTGFQFCGLSKSEESYDLSLHFGIGDTLYLGTVALASRNDVRLSYPIKLRKNVLGYWVCPKCHRADKTLEMVYGDGIATDFTSRKRPQGCINNGTRGYCNRDQIHF